MFSPGSRQGNRCVYRPSQDLKNGVLRHSVSLKTSGLHPTLSLTWCRVQVKAIGDLPVRDLESFSKLTQRALQMIAQPDAAKVFTW